MLPKILKLFGYSTFILIVRIDFKAFLEALDSPTAQHLSGIKAAFLKSNKNAHFFSMYLHRENKLERTFFLMQKQSCTANTISALQPYFPRS